MTEPARRHDGIDVRHGRGCRSRDGESRCNCTPTYRAEAFDRRSQKKLRKSFPTLAAAKAWRADAMGDLRRGVRRGPTGMTLRQAGEEWIDGARDGSVRTRSGDVYKPSALRGYEAALRGRVFPAIGGMKLEDVTRADLQALADRLLGEGLDASTIRNALMPVRVVFRRLVSRGVLAVNPATGLDLPAPRGRRDRIASPAEAAVLIAALPSGDRPVWATAIYAGLRGGELQGLDWGAVDLAGGTIAVERAWDPKEHEYVAPKSKAGRRRVPIAAILRDVLVEHKMNTGGAGLVFGRPDGRPFAASVLRQRALRHWKAETERRRKVDKEAPALNPITLHECRHTYASLMIAAGVNAKALSTYLGHANIAITFDRYGHLMPGSEDEAANLLDAFLKRADTAARLAQIDAS